MRSARCGTRAILLGQIMSVALGTFACIPAFSASQNLPPSDDTFINDRFPGNNNGGSASIFTGTEDQGGHMRGLIRFEMPSSLAGRVAVIDALLQMTTRAVGNGGPGSPATVKLHAITEPWAQGVNIGAAPMLFVVGQPCSGSAGASWSFRNCPAATAWTTPGGTIAPGESASASVPASIDTTTSWSSAGMASDVQGWIDAPSTNFGWLVTSSTETMGAGVIQRFYSSEAGTFPPALSITYGCKSGFAEVNNLCTACTAAAQSSCGAQAEGNACNDSGPPATTYSCTCNNPLYRPGLTESGGAACMRLTLDIDDNGAAEPLYDGLLIVRYLFGFRGDALIADATGAGAKRTSPDLVLQYLDDIRFALDVDGDGNQDALTDGLILVRYLFGLRGPALIAGGLSPGATRTGPQIESHIATLMP